MSFMSLTHVQLLIIISMLLYPGMQDSQIFTLVLLVLKDWAGTVLTCIYTIQCVHTVAAKPNLALRFILLVNYIRPESHVIAGCSERSITV